jgi:hypothetical protein
MLIYGGNEKVFNSYPQGKVPYNAFTHMKKDPKKPS